MVKRLAYTTAHAMAYSLGGVLVLVWLSLRSAEGFPSNDDPFYGRPAQIFAEESRFQIIRQEGELSASSVAHFLIGGSLAKVIGYSYRTLFLAVIFQFWIASILIYRSARQAGCELPLSVFWTGLFLFNPLCFGHNFTFMTDGPAMCWAVAAVVAFQSGIRQRALGWLLLGSTAAGIAFWMRQTHLLVVGFPVVSLFLVLLSDRDWKRFIVHCLSALAPAAAAVLLFESGWIVFGDDGRVHTILPQTFDYWQWMINVYGLAILMGFLFLPAMPVFVCCVWPTQRQDSNVWDKRCGVIASVLLLIPLVATQGRACLTSATATFIQNAHLGPIFLSDFEIPERWSDMGGVAWPAWVWQILTLLSILNAGLLVSFIVSAITSLWHQRGKFLAAQTIPVALLVTAMPITFLILSVSTGVLDRYWMLLLPLAFLFVPEVLGDRLRLDDKVVRFACVGLLVIQLAFSTVMVRDFLVWNQTRWHAYEGFLTQGYEPQDIDGGRDMNAWYRSAEDPNTMAREGDTAGWWSGLATVAISIGPRQGWTESGKVHWYSWATLRQHTILLLKKTDSQSTP